MIYKAIIIFAFLLIILTTAAFWGPENTYNFSNQRSVGDKITRPPPEIPGADAESNQNSQQEDFSFLLLGKVGSGQGGQWHSAPNLADTIILVNFKQREKTVNLISLPRDLYGNFGNETFKINEIIHRDKIGQLLEKLPEITGVKTDKFLVIDLSVVKKVVDEMGGIYLELLSDVVDPVSGYTMKKGYQRLSGEDAAWLIRNRFGAGGDFFREKNQQSVIKAIYRRYQTLNQIEKMKFFLNLGSEIKKIKTNLSISEAVSLLHQLDKETEFNEITLDFSTGLLESSSASVGSSTAYILIPKAGINNYEEIKKFIASKF